MIYKDVYKANKKWWKIYTLGFLIFWIPALAIDLMPNYDSMITLPLKVAGLVFLILAYPKAKCPKCKRLPGFSWNVKSCRYCGERLS